MATKADHVRRAPRWALLFAMGLIALATTSALVVQHERSNQPKQAGKQPTETVAFRFEDGRNGTVVVREAGSARVLKVLQPGTHGFVRTVMRSLAQERLRNGHDRSRPFRISYWADGRLTVSDPTTGRTVNLLAFGLVNAKSFARLLVAARKQRRLDARSQTGTVQQ